MKTSDNPVQYQTKLVYADVIAAQSSPFCHPAAVVQHHFDIAS
jgi:hypothetical protein